jgi:hypothetical protein
MGLVVARRRSLALLLSTLALTGISLVGHTGKASASTNYWCGTDLWEGYFCPGSQGGLYKFTNAVAYWGTSVHSGCDMHVWNDALRSDNTLKYSSDQGCNQAVKAFPNNTQYLWERLIYSCVTCSGAVQHYMTGYGDYYS